MFITIFSILLLLSYVLAKAITATAKVITTTAKVITALAFIFVQPVKNILYKCIYETKNKKMVGQV
jgi:hypothetical protein